MNTIKLPNILNDLYFQKVILQVGWGESDNAATMWLPRNETIDDILKAMMEAAKNTKDNPPFFLPIGSDGENEEDIPHNYALYVEETQPPKKLYRLQGVLDYQRFVRVSRNEPLKVRLVRAFPRLGSEEHPLRKGIWKITPRSNSFIFEPILELEANSLMVKLYPAQTDGNCFALEVIKKEKYEEKEEDKTTLNLSHNGKIIMPHIPRLLQHDDILVVKTVSGEPKKFKVAYDFHSG